MTDTAKKYIPRLEAEPEEMQELRQELDGMKHEYSIAMMGELIESLKGTLEKIEQAANSEKQFFDKDLGKNLSESISNAITKLGELSKPHKIDFTPIMSIASEIGNQNKTIFEAISKIPVFKNDNTGSDLVNMLAGVILKNNEFIERGMKQVNYSEELNKINLSINRSMHHTVYRNAVGKIEYLISKPI